MDFDHLKEQLKHLVEGMRGRGAQNRDDPHLEDHNAARELEREIAEAHGLSHDAEQDDDPEWDDIK